MLQAVIASLKKAGIAVPDDCDEATAIALVNERLLPTDNSGRDWSFVDACWRRLEEALEHQDDFKPERIRRLEDDLVKATKAAAISFVFFSDVRAARPHGHALLDFIQVVKEELRNVPLPGAVRVR